MAKKKVLKVVFGLDSMARVYRGTTEQYFSLDKFIDWKMELGDYDISDWARMCDGHRVADCIADGWCMDNRWTVPVYDFDLTPYAVFSTIKDLTHNVRVHVALGYTIQYITQEV